MFNYEYPDHFHLLWALPAGALLLWGYWSWRRRSVDRLGDPALVKRLLPEMSSMRFWLKNALFGLGLVLLTISWANPQRGAKQQKATQESADVFIALDISQSMLARDIAPSRLEYAQVFAKKLVQALEGERIGLIFFAGDAFLQMPLSTDYNFLIQSLQNAEPDLITEQGTAIPTAIDLAMQSFGDQPGGGRALILITDGENHDEDAVDRAEAAYDDGIVLSTVGAGTTDGGPIPVGGSEFSEYKRDENGEVVRTRLNQQLLFDLARAGGGQTFNIKQSDAAIGALKQMVNGLEKREVSLRSYTEFESYFQWFLLPALLLLLIDTWIPFHRKN
jgi:Ca-activated chloride channel family protein